jgi:hypothetical protein
MVDRVAGYFHHIEDKQADQLELGHQQFIAGVPPDEVSRQHDLGQKTSEI